MVKQNSLLFNCAENVSKEVKKMMCNNLSINKQGLQKQLLKLISIMCILSVNLTGCQNKSNIPSGPDLNGIMPKSPQAKQTQSDLNTASTDAKTAYQSSVEPINITSDNQDTTINEMKLPQLNTLEDSQKNHLTESNTTETGNITIKEILQEYVQPGEQIATANDTTATTVEQSLLGPSVNMPLLDRPGMPDELISVNFNQVDIRTVLKTIGDITGINFIVDNSISGSVTVMSPTKLPLGQVYELLESILEVQGYAAVPAGDIVKIVPKAEATKRNLQVRIGSDPSEIAQNDSIVSQIMPLRFADVTEVSQIIQPLLSTGAQLSIYSKTNSLVITDISSNIHYIAKIVQKLDVEGSKEQVTVFNLNYASAQILSEQIIHIMQKTKALSLPNPRIRNTTQIETDTKILPDTRTNSLVVVADNQDTETVARLVKQLDVKRPTGTNNVHVIYLKNAQAEEVAESLTAALANLRITGALEAVQTTQVTADAGTNALIIAASPQDYEVIAEIIEKLDIIREQVLVELLIVEVSEDSLKQIGIDWATLDEAVTDSVRFFGATNFGPRVDLASGNLEGLAIGAWKKSSDSTAMIGTILHALEKQSGVNILSTPHILTSNHHKAKIVVGENRAFVKDSRITETTDFITPTVIKTFEYRDVGITLEITPHISQGGLIRLEINSEFTKIIEDVVTPSADTPATAKRQAETVVTMNSGSTVVIGGLIRDDKVTVDRKVPLLGDIPGLGALFKYTTDRLQKTNLLIFITPKVMSSQKDLEQATAEKRKEMTPLMENLEKRTAKTK
jgi:general secretion pathway protein D